MSHFCNRCIQLLPSALVQLIPIIVIDCVKKGQPNEDFLVELKRDWIEKGKAARRIAGHANAARGENILWLIGVDEKQGVIGVNATDLAIAALNRSQQI